MRILIVEDEKLAVRQLKEYIKEYDPAAEILPSISSAAGLRKWFADGVQVDVIFCDIELSDGNALHVLAEQKISAIVIFTTAYDHFWREALKLNGVEYLLKPLTSEGVHGALSKIENIRFLFSKDEQVLSRLSAMVRTTTPNFKKRFPVKIGNELLVIEADTVHFFRIATGIVFAHVEKNRHYPLDEATLSELEEMLNPEFFFRINRSEIVNSKYIERIRIEPNGLYQIQVKGIANHLTVSTSRQTAFKEWLRTS